ncbi:hypothetical protein Tco_1009512 [Tanacetum coccineum]
MDVDARGAVTTDIGLDAGHGSDIIHKTPTRLNDAPLSGGRMIEDINLDVDTSLVQPHATKDFHFVTPTKISASGEAHSLDISPEDQLGGLSVAKILADAASFNNASDSIPVKDKDPGQREDERVEVVAKVNQAHDIDWSDPAVLRYHALQNRSFSVAELRKNMCTYLKNQGGYKKSHFKGMSYADVRPILESVWDRNHAFVPKDYEIEKKVMKRPGFDLQQKSIKKNEKIKASGFVLKQPAGEEKGKKKDAESSKQVEEEIV